jgi:hypothetical protein
MGEENGMGKSGSMTKAMAKEDMAIRFRREIG